MALIASPNDRVEYNSYRFPDSPTKTEVTFSPIPDAAGRTTAYTLATVKVETIIADGANQDVTLSSVRTALEAQGGRLTVSGKGLGTFDINAPGGRQDLKWGPRTKFLTWRSLGGGQAASVTWQCEAALLNCSAAPWAGQIMSYSYSLDIGTDKGGYTTRVHSGTLVIPATRAGVVNPVPPDTADAYFDRVVPDLLPNFERTIQRSLSEDKCTLKFTVTDTERPGNALPDGVIEGEVSHDVNTTGGAKGGVFLRWSGVIRAQYELQKGVPRTTAAEYFFKKLLKDRVAGDRALGWFYMPLALSISEPQIHGRTGAAFSFTYALMWNDEGTLKYRFPTGGLWRPTPGTDWNKWSLSLNLARANRGISSLRHQASDDVIVDLCLNDGGNRLRGGAGGSVARGLQREATKSGQQIDWAQIGSILGVPAQVSPIGSWVSYECRIIVEPIDHICVHKPLPIAAIPSTGQIGASSSAIKQVFSSRSTSFYSAPQTSPKTIIQNRGSTDFYLRLVGRAMRVGHEISPPTMLGVGNAPVYPANHPDFGTYFSTWTGGYTTHPLQCAEWSLRYFCQLPQGAQGLSISSPPRPDEPSNVNQGTVR